MKRFWKDFAKELVHIAWIAARLVLVVYTADAIIRWIDSHFDKEEC